MRTRYWLSIILFFIAFAIRAIDFSVLNTSYWYDPNRGIDISYRVIQQNGENVVYIGMRDMLNAKGEFHFLLQEDYVSEQHRELVSYQLDTLQVTNNNVMVALRIDPGPGNILVVHYRYDVRNVDFYYPISLKRGKMDAVSFYPVDSTDLPILTTYLRTRASFAPVTDSLYFFQYEDNFNPADPPMGAVQTVSPSLSVDTVLKAVNTSDFQPGHFYFIQKDTLSTEGITIYSAQPYFPNSRILEELVMPLTYFSRTSELTGILESPDPKKEFDEFWIRTFGSKEMARSAIRSYYRKVAQANELFTDYKQGWKTERGIIYIVFGVPEEVYRDNRQEIWRYSDTEFEFRIISNLFAPELYVLMRDKDYEEAWNLRIRLLRGG